MKHKNHDVFENYLIELLKRLQVLRYFTIKGILYPHKKRDYVIAAFTFLWSGLFD